MFFNYFRPALPYVGYQFCAKTGTVVRVVCADDCTDPLGRGV